MFVYEPLINPPKEYPRWLAKLSDNLSWTLPVASAGLSVWGGIEALLGEETWAAVLSILGGVIGAAAVVFTNMASRVRDQLLARAQAVGSLALEIADRADRQSGPQI